MKSQKFSLRNIPGCQNTPPFDLQFILTGQLERFMHPELAFELFLSPRKTPSIWKKHPLVSVIETEIVSLCSCSASPRRWDAVRTPAIPPLPHPPTELTSLTFDMPTHTQQTGTSMSREGLATVNLRYSSEACCTQVTCSCLMAFSHVSKPELVLIPEH